MLRLFCQCGYPLWVAARWTGTTIELFMLDGTQEAEQTGPPLQQCPRCQRVLHPDQLEGYPLTRTPSAPPPSAPRYAPLPRLSPAPRPPRPPAALPQAGQEGTSEPPPVQRRLPRWRSAAASPHSPGTWRVLVVDDDREVRESVQEWLEDEGLEIASASDGLEALAILRREGGHWLVLLDLLMPRMDGWGFLDRLQSDSLVQEDPKIVLMSAGWVLAQEGPPWRSPQVVAAVPKPFDPADLLAQIHALTSASSGEQHE